MFQYRLTRLVALKRLFYRTDRDLERDEFEGEMK